MRKIYLDTHSRHYLVVCELHCDVAGFPSPDAREVCQAGLVVRRRHLSYPGLRQGRGQGHRPGSGRGGVGHRRPRWAGLRMRLAPRRLSALAARAVSGLDPGACRARREALGSFTRGLPPGRTPSGAHWVLEGWLPGGPRADRLLAGGGGRAPGPGGVLAPHVAALRRPRQSGITTPPAAPSSTASCPPRASTPTASGGKARFDDRTTYEIRCFVRRHDPRCPRGEAPDCHGELIWSEATEPYRLAPPFDLEGTSQPAGHHPDAQPGGDWRPRRCKRPIGQFSPGQGDPAAEPWPPRWRARSVRAGTMGGPAICFISIPLITIVAYFVFSLFLPIVVFLFGLWFLLAFKFCIPPQIAFDVGLELKLDAAPPSIDADFGVNVEIEGAFELVDRGLAQRRSQRRVCRGLLRAYGFDSGEAANESRRLLQRSP